MIKIGDYNTIMNDHNIFNQVVYTPLSEALRLLEERRKDPVLMAKVEELLKGDIPEILKSKKCAVLGRHIATPNHESRRFIDISKENNLLPVFFEYHEDKFTANNHYKHSLGQLKINTKGTNSTGDACFEKITIVDFNKYTGKKLNEIRTLWDEPLINFHKKLFSVHNYTNDEFYTYDASTWFTNHGGQKAAKFYTNLLSLFVCNGILFENFLTSKDKEGDFTKEIVLPAIENIINKIGVKPLIVPLEPLDLEADNFWVHHLLKIKNLIPKHD